MDGSYGNAFPPRSTQLSPSSPASSSTMYKTNVNRSKTKKWVEAKVQSYDGDDWGADYDEPEEQPPLPPAKPMGPRQVSGPPSSAWPAQPSDLTASSAGLRSPSGPPALQIQTQSQQQQAPAPAAPGAAPPASHADTDSPWRARRSATDPMALPPQSTPAPPSAATASSVYSGAPAQSQTSSTPQSAGPAPLRFPPRKSSMSSQQDPADYAELARQAPSTTSDSSQKPQNEPRPVSPANAKSPKSPNKPLPFIRPADIYRRMEEERERERRSMDSARPSLDGSDPRGSLLGSGPASPQTQTPQRAAKEPTQDAQSRTSIAWNPGPEARTEAGPSSRPTLAPVAERKSEYGLEGLLASYGTEEGPAESAPMETLALLDIPQPPEQSDPAQSGGAQTAGTEKDLRRFSTSPKLPDLARMSAFGDDLFSGSSRSSMPGPQLLPVVSDKSQDTVPAPSGPARVVSPVLEKEEPPFPADLAVSSSIAPGTRSNVSSPAPPDELPPVATLPKAPAGSHHPATLENTTSEDPASPLAQDHAVRHVASQFQGEESDLAAPAAGGPGAGSPEGEARHPVEEEQSRTPRPSIPGGWVSETPSTPGYTGAATPGPLQTGVLPVALYPRDTGGISPVSENDSSDEDTSVVEKREPGVPSAHALVGAPGTGIGMTSAPPSPPPPPPVVADPPPAPLVPHQTTSPAPAASSEAHFAHHSVVQSEDEMAGATHAGVESPQDEPTTPVPSTAATAQRDITPTAPLNPRKDAHDTDLSNQGFVAPPSLERVSTIDTNTSSPVKESDVLSEEIIRSLSPMSPSTPLPQPAGFGGSAVYTGTAEAPRENAVRESTYLGDVYGDYWSANDEKAGQDAPGRGGQGEVAGAPESVTTPKRLDTARMEPALLDNPAPVPKAAALNAPSPRLRERFSWEVPSEDLIEPKSLGTELEVPTIGTPTAEPASDGEQDEAADLYAPRLAPSPTTGAPDPAKPGQAAASSISHQVSQVSTIPPRNDLEVPIEPPSPVSVLSERNATAPETHRLSLRDEKALVQSSSVPMAPSPPRDQHPALQEGPPAGTERTGQVAAMAPPAPAPPQSLSIIPFRQILDTPSPSDRIRLYRETRQQFASLDTGLGRWVAEMRALQPEHATATSSFSASFGSPAGDMPAGGFSGSPQGPQPPYHQQYLNASTTRVGSPGGRASNMPMPPPPLQGTNSFGHTSNQVGVKGKELLMAAGKAGKGLLSKGKNKLRNTGDKVFSS